MRIKFSSNHGHVKQKDSLESSQDRVLFAAELEFPNIPVPMPGSSIICGWTWVPEDAITQATSEYIKWMWHKIKTILFFIWLASWNTNISLIYYSDNNLFLTDYASWELCNVWLLLFEYHYIGVTLEEQPYCSIPGDRVIDDNLKSRA